MARSIDDELFNRHAGSTMINPNSRSTRQQESLIHQSSHQAVQKHRGLRHTGQASKPQAKAVKSGINFFNYTGTTVTLSASTDELDEEMNSYRKDKPEVDDALARRKSTSLVLSGQQIEKVGKRRQHQQDLSQIVLKMEGNRYN